MKQLKVKVEKAEFGDLLGQKIESILLRDGDSKLFLRMSSGERFVLYKKMRGCEEAYLDEAIGDWADIIGQTILRADVRMSSDPTDPLQDEQYFEHYVDSPIAWTFYELATIRGSLTLRFVCDSGLTGSGTDSKYVPYSIEMDFAKIIQPERTRKEPIVILVAREIHPAERRIILKPSLRVVNAAPKDLRQRAAGTFIGLAVGDFLNCGLKFNNWNRHPKIKNDLGSWEDNTAMAFCIAKSLIVEKEQNLRSQIDHYTKWDDGDEQFTGGRRPKGLMWLSLMSYKVNGNPKCGSFEDPGDSCISRLAPVPIFYRSNLSAAVFASGWSSRTLYQSKVCVDACRYFGALVWGALNGATKDELLRPYFPSREFWKTTKFDDELRLVIEGSFKENELLSSSGDVRNTLENALWAFFHTENFKDGAMLAVNFGERSASNGSVFGQLAGAFYGIDAIPGEWLSVLCKKTVLLETANELFDASAEHTVEEK